MRWTKKVALESASLLTMASRGPAYRKKDSLLSEFSNSPAATAARRAQQREDVALRQAEPLCVKLTNYDKSGQELQNLLCLQPIFGTKGARPPSFRVAVLRTDVG